MRMWFRMKILDLELLQDSIFVLRERIIGIEMDDIVVAYIMRDGMEGE